MVIDNIGGTTPQQPGNRNKVSSQNSQETRTGSKAPATSTSAGLKEESVSVSARAQGLQALETRIKTMPDSDEDRVNALKAAIENGTYQVDAQKVAQKMLDFDSSMF